MVDTSEKRQVMSLDEIFFASEEKTPNYIPRPNIDDVFFRNMKNGKTIIVYGGPQSGKTALIHKRLQDSESVWFYCSDFMTLADVNKQILKRGGYRAPDETTVETNQNATVSGAATVALPIAELEYTAEHASGETLTNTYRSDLNLEDPNDIADALKDAKFDDYIVIEDFHKLAEQVQEKFASQLKTLIAEGIRFVICGEGYSPFQFADKYWKQSGKLAYINVSIWDNYSIGSQTASRTDPPNVRVNVSAWDDHSLKSYIAICEEFLNIRYSENFTQSLLQHCFGVLGIVRAVCCEVCKQEGILETQGTQITGVGATADVEAIIRDIFGQSNDPYPSFLEKFGAGFDSKAKHALYKWILHTIFTATPQELTEGLPLAMVKERIMCNQRKLKNEGEITKALQQIDNLQKTKCGSCMVLKYDTYKKTLHILDKDFLVWLNVQDKDELIKSLKLPSK